MRARRTPPPAFAALCVLCLLPAACAVPQVVPPMPAPVEIGRPGVRAEPPATDQPLRLTLGEAVLMALENNRALRVERLSPPIRRTFEEEERAAFDPVVSADAEADAAKVTGPGKDASSTSLSAGASVRQFLPTGTTVEAGLSTARTDTSATRPVSATRAGLSVTQALLRGRGRDVNLASLRQARLDTQFTQYELRGFAEGLVAQVEDTYWDYVLALRRVEIFEGSLALARQQLEETQQRIRVGRAGGDRAGRRPGGGGPAPGGPHQRPRRGGHPARAAAAAGAALRAGRLRARADAADRPRRAAGRR